jgi:histidyl-tRNA synthetase
MIISKEYNIDIDLFRNAEIGALFALDFEWLSKLISIRTSNELEKLLNILPLCLKEECTKLITIANNIEYENVNISPIYYSAMKYYDDIYYRFIKDNLTIAKGGGYKSDGISSLGFAVYTDNLLKVIEG